MRRLTILLAAVGALLLVPAAQAFAAGTMELHMWGPAKGAIKSGNPEEGQGTPKIECSWDGKKQTGVCKNELESIGEIEAVALHATAEEGPVWWNGEELFIKGQHKGGCFFGSGGCTVGTEIGKNETIKVNAIFCLAGTTEEECEKILPPPEGPPLTLNIEEGSGTVVSNPAGLECLGSAPKSCTTKEIAAGPVTLTASPASGYAFKSWKGCPGTVNGRQCTFEHKEPGETVGVKFVPTKNVKVSVSGSGSVKSKPGGIICLPSCTSATAAFAEGSTVELLQTASKHWTFAGWSGDCSGTGECKPVMSANREVTATFTEVPKKTLTLTKSGGGTSLIKTKPTGINCGYTCSTNAASFYEGEPVAVSWKLNKGTTSIEWTTGAGTCTGKSVLAEGTCSLTIGASNVALTAKLE